MSKSLAIVLAELAEVRDLLATVAAMPDLPALFTVNYSHDFSRDGNPLVVRALMDYPDGDTSELAEIDGIRAWAQAMGGVLFLSEPVSAVDGGQTVRRLSALRRLPSGPLLEVYTSIATTQAAPAAHRLLPV